MSTTDPTGTPLEALVIDWVRLYVSNLYDRSTNFAEDFADLRKRVIARCATLGIKPTARILAAVPDWHIDHDTKPVYGEVVMCEQRGRWFQVDAVRDDGSVYLIGDYDWFHELLGPIPLDNLTNLGPTEGRFWTGDGYATGNHWDLVNGTDFPIIKRNKQQQPQGA